MGEALLLVEGTLALWPVVLVGTFALAMVRRAARAAAFAFGLAFFLVVAFGPVGPGGLHGEGFAIAFFGLALCAAAILGEGAAQARRLVRRRGREGGGAGEGMLN